jgi:hypothetical protein
MLVKFERDAAKNTFSWVYTGGCYADNKAVIYTDASPGESYNFKDIQFEVRLDTRVNAEIANSVHEEEEDTEDLGDDISGGTTKLTAAQKVR